MSTNYHKIGVDEFEAVMNDYDAERVSVDRVKEYVYDIPTAKDGLVVRVFSTLDRKNAGARDAGHDAIRALAWSETADVPVASATRTHRIDTWESNLRPKIDTLVSRINSGEFDDDTPDATLAGLVPVEDDEDAVVVADLVDTRYGKKAVLSSPYEAKDAIKSLEWDDTHRSWDKGRSAWTVDAKALPLVADELDEKGWPLRAPALEPDEPEGFTVESLAERVERGDHITVEYTAKKYGTEKAVAGEVTYAAAKESLVEFARESDGHVMYVKPDGLFTSRSAYPFVGEIDDVTVEVALHA